MNTDQRFIRQYLIRNFRELENERSGCQEGGGGSEKVLEVLLVYWGKRKEAASHITPGRTNGLYFHTRDDQLGVLSCATLWGRVKENRLYASSGQATWGEEEFRDHGWETICLPFE